MFTMHFPKYLVVCVKRKLVKLVKLEKKTS
jgi:hypothetical protein